MYDFQEFRKIVCDDEYAHLMRYAADKGYSEKDMKDMLTWDFMTKILVPLDRTPEYKRKKRYYELQSREKAQSWNAKAVWNDRNRKYAGWVDIYTGKYPARHEPVFCTHCGIPLYAYDSYHEFPDKILCGECYSQYRFFQPTISHHIPGAVERDDIPTEDWDGYYQFLCRHPLKEGWHYALSDGHIMEVKDNGKKWWVLWNIQHSQVLKELLDVLPDWK